MVILVVLILATPFSVGRVPDAVTAILLFATLGVLLVSGQTMIFLLRLVAAERRDRREPLAARTPTVGQLEDADAPETAPEPTLTPEPTTPDPTPEPSPPRHDATNEAGHHRGPVPD
jgi:hypothetical protein